MIENLIFRHHLRKTSTFLWAARKLTASQTHGCQWTAGCDSSYWHAMKKPRSSDHSSHNQQKGGNRVESRPQIATNRMAFRRGPAFSCKTLERMACMQRDTTFVPPCRCVYLVFSRVSVCSCGALRALQFALSNSTWLLTPPRKLRQRPLTAERA